jgi:phage-related protein
LNEIFKLVGSIFIKSDSATAEIDNITGRAKELGSTIGQTMQTVGDKISSFGSKLLPVSVAIVGLGTVAVQSSAEIKALNSQFEQTFGELQGQASEALRSVANECGIMQTRLQGVGTSIYAFAKSSGADSAEAMSLMETALRATADASAYYDRSLEETSESLMSFLKGNFANDAQLGVSCTETTRNAKAMELFGQKYNDLSEIQKQQTLLKMVTDAQALSGAMGQASRESDGFENVMGNLKESVKILGAELGEVLLPTVINLIQKLTGLVQKFSQMDDKTKKLIVTLAGIVAGIAPVLIGVGKVTSAVGTMIGAFGKLKTIIPTIGTALKGLGSSFISFLASPVGIAIAVIAVLVTAFVSLWKNNEEFRNKIIGIWNQVKDTFNNFTQGIVDRLNSLGFNFESIAEVLKAIWDGFCSFLAPIFEGVFQYIADVFKTITDVILGIVDVFIALFKGDWEGAWNAVRGIYESIWNGMVAWLKNIGNTLRGVLDVICGWFGTSWNNVKSAVSGAINNVISTISNGLNNAKNTVSNILTNIKSKFTSIFDSVKNIVKTAIDKVKSMFNFNWSLPKIKMPHFSISPSGWKIGDLLKGSIPKLGISWYAKAMDNPMLFTRPTLFDVNPVTGHARGAGEAGDEVMIGKNTMLNMIQEAVAQENAQMMGSVNTVLNRIFDLLSEYVPEMAHTQLVLDTGVMVGELAPAMDTALGAVYRKKKRGV